MGEELGVWETQLGQGVGRSPFVHSTQWSGRAAIHGDGTGIGNEGGPLDRQGSGAGSSRTRGRRCPGLKLFVWWEHFSNEDPSHTPGRPGGCRTANAPITGQSALEVQGQRPASGYIHVEGTKDTVSKGSSGGRGWTADVGGDI